MQHLFLRIWQELFVAKRIDFLRGHPHSTYAQRGRGEVKREGSRSSMTLWPRGLSSSSDKIGVLYLYYHQMPVTLKTARAVTWGAHKHKVTCSFNHVSLQVHLKLNTLFPLAIDQWPPNMGGWWPIIMGFHP